MEWDDLEKLEKHTYGTKKQRKIGASSEADVKRAERDLMRAELGDMEDD